MALVLRCGITVVKEVAVVEKGRVESAISHDVHTTIRSTVEGADNGNTWIRKIRNKVVSMQMVQFLIFGLGFD